MGRQLTRRISKIQNMLCDYSAKEKNIAGEEGAGLRRGLQMNGRPGEGKGASQAEVCGKSVSARRKGEFTGAEAGEDSVCTQDSKESMRRGRGEPRVVGMRPAGSSEASIGSAHIGS